MNKKYIAILTLIFISGFVLGLFTEFGRIDNKKITMTKQEFTKTCQSICLYNIQAGNISTGDVEAYQQVCGLPITPNQKDE